MSIVGCNILLQLMSGLPCSLLNITDYTSDDLYTTTMTITTTTTMTTMTTIITTTMTTILTITTITTITTTTYLASQ